MFTIEKAPAEIWLQIFEHLDLKDLLKLHHACGTFWGTLVARAAAKSIGSFLNPFAHVECPFLLVKRSVKREDGSYRLGRSDVNLTSLCPTLRLSGLSDSEMSLELNCFRVADDFHKCCEGGPEPVEMTNFDIEFKFVSSEDKDIKISFEYLTTFTTPITETPEDNGHINRTISHKLKLDRIAYIHKCKSKGLPKEWVNFFDPEISVTFTLDPRKSQHIGGYRCIHCLKSELTAFKATWNFKWIPSAKMGKILREGDRRKFYER
jgi:hypothetical protein